MDTYILKTISQPTKKALFELGKSEKQITEIGKKRILLVILLDFMLFPLLIMTNPNKLLALLPLVGSFLIWILIDRSYSKKLKEARRDKHFEFLNFAKLVVPYLKTSSETKSLFTILLKMQNRMEESDLNDNLNRLLIEMGETPGSADPMIRFSKAVSNTDLAEDFMVALFDWQQVSDDVAVIARMEQKITQAMIVRIDEIIKYKEERFNYYVARVFYSVFILMMGVLGVVIFSQLAPLFQML